jgi:hypothetical protein
MVLIDSRGNEHRYEGCEPKLTEAEGVFAIVNKDGAYVAFWPATSVLCIIPALGEEQEGEQ